MCSKLKLQLLLRIADLTGNLPVSVCLQEYGNDTFYQLYQIIQPIYASPMDSNFRERLSRVLFKTFTFRLKAELDVCDGQETVRTTVDRLDKLNHSEYGYQLLEELSK